MRGDALNEGAIVQARVRPNFSVQIQLLQSCNLRCRHCYDAGAARAGAPSTPKIFEWIDRIDDLCSELAVVPALHLSGGEPTLRGDLPEIVDYAVHQRGRDVLLFTNGTRWTADYIRRLERAGLRYVQVSLEGPEAINDEVRGTGVYRAALGTLEMLVARGLRVTVSVTVTARNYPHLEELTQLLDPLGVHFHVREVLPLGAGATCDGLSREERRSLYLWAIGYKGSSTVGLEDPIHCSALPSCAPERLGCVAGRSHFCVDVDGTIYPCRPLSWAVGHVSALRTAWYSPNMQRLRMRNFDGQCGRCQLRENCGGCRVHAHENGNVFGEDTRCFASEHDLVFTTAEARAAALGERVGSAIGGLLRRLPQAH